MTFTLPSLPVSINAAYQVDHRRRRVYLSDKARRWKNDSSFLVPRFEVPEEAFLRIDFVAHYPWRHRNGKLRRFDVSNLIKLLHDMLCERWGVDDCIVKSGSFQSVDDVQEKVTVTVTTVEANHEQKT